MKNKKKAYKTFSLNQIKGIEEVILESRAELNKFRTEIKDKDIVSKKRELPTFYGWKPLPIFEFITLLDNLIDYVSIHPSSQILEYDLCSQAHRLFCCKCNVRSKKSIRSREDRCREC